MIWDGNDLHVIVDHPNRFDLDDKVAKKYVFESDKVNVVSRRKSLLDILMECGVFKSRNDARRSWKFGFDLKEGFNRFERFGKLKRNIYVLNLPESLCSRDEFYSSSSGVS